MTLKTLSISSLALILTTGIAAADFKQVRTEKQFKQLVLGKSLTDDAGNVFVANADGSISAKLTKGEFTGSWVWNKRFFCRNGVFNGKELGTDCQMFEIDGKMLRMTRNKGKGETVLYRLSN